MAKPDAPQIIVKPSAEGVLAAVSAVAKKGPPPVHLWNPAFCGDIDMRIDRDGLWFYLGTPIGRPAMVKLFSSILKREGDAYFLVTPVEKVGIRVDDLPLHANDVTVTDPGPGQSLHFTTKTDDVVTAGPDHPIRVTLDPMTGEPAPAVMVRRDLWARIDRKTFFRLVDLGCHHPHQGASWFGLWSNGVFFPVIPSAELP